MSKSLGNFFTVREILAKYDPEIVRFYILSTHYRSPLDFDDTKLEMNKKSLVRLHNAIDNLESSLKNHSFSDTQQASPVLAEAEKLLNSINKAEADFRQAMDDDFNTALAIASLFDMARESNNFVKLLSDQKSEQLPASAQKALEQTKAMFYKLGEILGLFEQCGLTAKGESAMVEKLMALLIEIRQEVRTKKEWATADAIRNKLGEIGIILEDTPQGMRWKIK
jgi:cysteinyl-tRNA synthetase